MRQELRRMELAAKGKTFLQLREDVLEFFRGQETKEISLRRCSVALLMSTWQPPRKQMAI